jgi:hypothetical protein
MSFGSNGIYVGGKDTFISELSGNWSVKGEVFPQVRSAGVMMYDHTSVTNHICSTSYSPEDMFQAGIMCCRASWAVRGLCPG